MKKLLLLEIIILFFISIMSINATDVINNDSLDNDNINYESGELFLNNKLETQYDAQKNELNNNPSNNFEKNLISTTSSNNDVVVTVSTYAQLDDKITHDARNTVGSSYTINLVKGTYNINRTLLWGSSNYIKNLTINGNGSTLNGQNTYQFMNLASQHHLTLKNMIIKNSVKGSTNSSSVVVMIGPGSLTIDNCTFSNNHGGMKGGVITNRGNTTVQNSKFINNTVDVWGAVIWSTGEYGGNIKFINNTFTKNIANYLNNNDKTALIYTVSGGTAIISNNVFTNNIGRCIHNYNNVQSIITNNRFISNNFTDYNIVIRGGIIDNYEASMNVINNTFNGITEGELRGGIIYNEIGVLLLKNNTFSNYHLAKGILSNQTCSKGGVIFNRNSSIEISNNIFNTNFIGNYTRGGVIFNNMGIINITNNDFNNKVHGYRISGLTIFNDVNGEITVKNNLFNSKLNGTIFCNSTLQKYIFNSNVLDPTGGNGTIGITKVIKTNPIITVNSVSGTLGAYVNLTANLKTNWAGKINESYVIFKINGITLKYANGSNVRVNVVNGIATLKYKIPSTWTQSSYTIESVYAGSIFFNGVRNNGTLTIPSNINNVNNLIQDEHFNLNDLVINDEYINEESEE